MANILKIEDFVGVWRLSANAYKSSNLDAYIEQVQDDTEFELQIKVDLTKDKYNDLLSVGRYKDFLLGLTYFNYVRDNFEPSTSGAVSINSSNSTATPREAVYFIASDRFNRAVNIWNKITLPFLREWAQVNTKVVTASDSGTHWVLILEDVTYLEDGDYITVNGLDYVISDLDKSLKTLKVDKVGVINSGDSVLYFPFNGLFLDEKLEKIVL